MSAAISGVKSNIKSGSLDLDGAGWSIDYEVNTFNSTTTGDLGWEDETASTQKISGSFDILYNPLKSPTGVSAALTPGSTPTLTLYVDLSASISYAGKALIKKLSVKQKTAEGVTVTVSFTSKGVWTVPS